MGNYGEFSDVFGGVLDGVFDGVFESVFDGVFNGVLDGVFDSVFVCPKCVSLIWYTGISLLLTILHLTFLTKV